MNDLLYFMSIDLHKVGVHNEVPDKDLINIIIEILEQFKQF